MEKVLTTITTELDTKDATHKQDLTTKNVVIKALNTELTDLKKKKNHHKKYSEAKFSGQKSSLDINQFLQTVNLQVNKNTPMPRSVFYYSPVSKELPTR
jgi:hypothetical protein